MTFQVFTATLTAPDGYRDTYHVDARTKTEARKIIGKLYRRDTPPPSAGFYSFSQCRLTWVESRD